MAEVYPLMQAAEAELVVLAEMETRAQMEVLVLVAMEAEATVLLEVRGVLVEQRAQQGPEIQELNMMLPTALVVEAAGARLERPAMAGTMAAVGAVLLPAVRPAVARTD